MNSDRTHLSDRTFTICYLIGIVVSATTAAGFTDWRWRVVAASLLTIVFQRILRTRLTRNRQAGQNNGMPDTRPANHQ